MCSSASSTCNVDVRSTEHDMIMALTGPLASALQFLKGVGPRRAADLQRAGLSTVEDLLYRFPTRYEDRGHFQTIASLRPGRRGIGRRRSPQLRHSADAAPALPIFEMLVRDRTGSLRAIWFNQPFLNDVFHPHQRVILFGKLELTSHGLQMQSPQYEIVASEPSDAEAARRRGRRARPTTRRTPAGSCRCTRRPAS